ncbi:hypothetical protein [Sphingomonas sp.]|uniref:hypothetical protein n=1 Tax=Sphingomonas sp. TaxID=28214 RepID=UPI0025DCC653|nr:hypothetical protein [Sphingomonas sp.]
MAPTDADILEAATDFRRAIDAAGQGPWQAKSMTYPRGCCGHSVELLARYLLERFGIRPEAVNQTATDSIGGWTGCHSWLEWNGLTIDISGDQFAWSRVIVTRTPLYHGRGCDEQRSPAPHEADGWWAVNCGSLWTAIRAHLPSYSS